MRHFVLSVFVLPILLVSGLANADEKPKADDKGKDKPAVGALPPHPLDEVFRGKNEAEIEKALLKSAIYKKAMAEALKAKKEQQDKFDKNPKLKDASPEQVARKKFLEVLMDETKKDKEEKKDK